MSSLDLFFYYGKIHWVFNKRATIKTNKTNKYKRCSKNMEYHYLMCTPVKSFFNK